MSRAEAVGEAAVSQEPPLQHTVQILLVQGGCTLAFHGLFTGCSWCALCATCCPWCAWCAAPQHAVMKQCCTVLSLPSCPNPKLDLCMHSQHDINMFGCMMVEAGDVDGMVSGARHTTAATIKPAMQVCLVSVAYGLLHCCLLAVSQPVVSPAGKAGC